MRDILRWFLHWLSAGEAVEIVNLDVEVSARAVTTIATRARAATTIATAHRTRG